jgi:protein-disulfide isomerase
MTDLRSAPVPPVRDDDHVRGPQDAALVILYADFTCPVCAVAHERLAARADDLRLVFRHFAVRARDPRALPAAAAAQAAARQGAFWVFHDALYADQGRLDDPHLWARAQRLGLDVARFDADRRAPATLERVRRDVRDGVRAGITATPTAFVGDRAYPGAPGADLLAALR